MRDAATFLVEIRKYAFLTSTIGVLLATPGLAEMTLSSADIAEGQPLDNDQVLEGFGCNGGNMSPALSWGGAPDETRSFVITVYDPDASTGSGFWHWSVFDVPATVMALPEGAAADAGSMPDGAVQARNDFSNNSFAGACPPEGRTHRYVFTVYAMPQENLPIDETASAALVGFFANTSALDSATITAVFTRE